MSDSRGIIVDDRNTQVLTYSGGWSQGTDLGGYQEYNTTTSTPSAQGASVVFPFNGTSVSVYGTLNGVSPTVLYTIDGIPSSSQISSSNGTGHHDQFYATHNLVDGQHILQIDTTQLTSTSTASWFLDYIVYTPSANPSLRPGESFFLDDADSTFQYSGTWSAGDGTGSDMQGTLHTALSLNSSVSLQFIGTYVDVFVRLPLSTSLQTIAQVVVDGGNPFIANYPPSTDVVFDPSTLASSNYRLYHNPFLSPGSHVMNITPTAEQALWLDYVIAGTGSDLSNPQDSPLLPSSTPSPTPSPGSTGSSQPGTSSPSHTIVVAGVAAGGAVLLTLLVVSIFMFHRKRKRKRRRVRANIDLLGDGDTNEMADLTPGSSGHTLVTPYNKALVTLDTASSEVPGLTGTTSSSRIGEKSQMQTETSTPPVAIVITPPDAPSSSLPPAIRHTDSGIRGLTSPASGISAELPPVYSLD